MATIGLYIRGLNQDEANALRSRLNDVAQTFGYTSTRGATAGEGNLAEMLTAIDAGELAVVLLTPEQHAVAAAWLRERSAELDAGAGTFRTLMLSEALMTLAEALEAARERAKEANQMEIIYGFHGLDLFDRWDDEESYDIPASAQKYADLIQQKLETEFPDAEIIVRYDLDATGVLPLDLRTQVDRWENDDLVPIIDQLVDDVYVTYDWVIAAEAEEE